MSFKRIGGIRFLRVGRIRMQWSIARKQTAKEA